MTPESKKLILRLLSNGRGDDLYRAELAFRNCTSEQMDQHYGQSGQTRREILNGYKKRDEEIDAAVAECTALISLCSTPNHHSPCPFPIA